MDNSIDRRQFLGGALALGAVGTAHSALRGSGLKTTLRPRVTPVATAGGSRILVVVTLYGGLDGLEAVVPYGDPNYYLLRGAVAIPQSSVLPIGGGLGFHPALTGTKALWDAGNVALIRGVGYPNPDYSHFTSMDIWQSGSPSGDLTTGWIGRWLDRTGTDPLRALWLGSNLPLAFVGDQQRASAIAPNPAPSTQLPPGNPVLLALYKDLERHRAGQTPLQTDVSRSATNMLTVGGSVAQILGHVPPMTKFFGSNAGALGTQLGVVSQLIAAGSRTSVYGVNLNGFDSHSGELVSYASLLAQLDASIAGFFQSIQGAPAAEDVVMVVYSEFGRRVAPNASGGTDHGSGNVAFVIGRSVVGGFYGDQPSLTQLDANGSLVVTTDFRSIYSTLLEQVLEVDPSMVLKSPPPPLAFVP